MIISAARSSIPCDRRPAAIPGLTREITQLMEKRDTLSASLHDNSSAEEREHLSSLNKDIENSIRLEKRDKWREFASSLVRRTPNTKIWKTIKQLNGRTAAAPPNAAIRFKSRAYHKPKAQATEFKKQYTTIVRHKTEKETRILNRKLQKLEHDTLQLLENQVRKAIKSCSNSKAFGPDELCIHYLKNLGRAALSRLTVLINLSFATNRISRVWKASTINPLLIPVKAPNESKSYRPVSLISPVAKFMEKYLAALPLVAHQH